jgi:hypothetical protein
LKPRLLLVIWIFSLTAGLSGQSRTALNSDFMNQTFASGLPGLEAATDTAAPDDQPLIPAGNPLGENSSRKSTLLPAAPPSAPVPAAQSPCQKPAELFSASEYSGPLNRLAAWFSRKPEMTTVPNHRRGKNVCGLDVQQKFQLFYKSTVDPVTFVAAGFNAGISQWQSDDREFGFGAQGYGKRYGAALADTAARNFFHQFFYPAILQQDPRYYRHGRGTKTQRIEHALAHSFVARNDSGHPMPNLSLWAGISSTVAVENLYRPGNQRGFAEPAKRAGISFGTGMGWDVLREFWPEIVHKMKLPFRERTVVPARP